MQVPTFCVTASVGSPGHRWPFLCGRCALKGHFVMSNGAVRDNFSCVGLLRHWYSSSGVA